MKKETERKCITILQSITCRSEDDENFVDRELLFIDMKCRMLRMQEGTVPVHPYRSFAEWWWYNISSMIIVCGGLTRWGYNPPWSFIIVWWFSPEPEIIPAIKTGVHPHSSPKALEPENSWTAKVHAHWNVLWALRQKSGILWNWRQLPGPIRLLAYG